ncbi:MAG: hypothetical protein ACE37F_01065 [Nannocystaceae bacterium]|nr:hypothetical protein [bacterium]
MHGECSSVCDSPFLECFDDARTCAQQWEADFFSGYDDPLVDDGLMRRCAEQVEAQSCLDLEPDSLECEFALVESCTGDRDEHGQPYSPFSAVPLAFGVPYDFDLCDGVSEFYALPMSAGTVLSSNDLGGADSVSVRLYELLETSDGDSVLHEHDSDTAVAQDGTYIVELEAYDRTAARLQFVAAAAE